MSRWSGDALLGRVLVACAALSGAILVLVVAYLVRETLPALEAIGPWRFATDGSWHPAPDAGDGTFGLAPMVAGSIMVTAGALLLAVPLGVASAVFCRFAAPPRIGRAYAGLVGLLAGVPSVVYGFWGLVVLVPLIARIAPPGASLLAGAIVLALMVLPTVALTADAALAAVPAELLRGAAATGLGRWTIVRRVALPAARSGVRNGVMLAVARALGETMAVLMVCGNIVQVPRGLLEPVRTLTANIALEMGYALGDHRAALFATGLLLTALVAGIVAIATRGEEARRA